MLANVRGASSARLVFEAACRRHPRTARSTSRPRRARGDPGARPVRVPGGGRGARAAARVARAREPRRRAALAGWGGLQDDGGASNATANATNATAAAAASFVPTAPPTTSPEILLYKRTHASADAEADALFLHTYFGMNVTINETIYKDVGPNGEQGGSLCAKRFGVGSCQSARDLSAPLPLAVEAEARSLSPLSGTRSTSSRARSRRRVRTPSRSGSTTGASCTRASRAATPPSTATRCGTRTCGTRRRSTRPTSRRS